MNLNKSSVESSWCMYKTPPENHIYKCTLWLDNKHIHTFALMFLVVSLDTKSKWSYLNRLYYTYTLHSWSLHWFRTLFAVILKSRIKIVKGCGSDEYLCVWPPHIDNPLNTHWMTLSPRHLVPQLFKQRLTISEAKISYQYCIVLREKPEYRIDIVSNEKNVPFKGDLDRALESKSSTVGDYRWGREPDRIKCQEAGTVPGCGTSSPGAIQVRGTG